MNQFVMAFLGLVGGLGLSLAIAQPHPVFPFVDPPVIPSWTTEAVVPAGGPSALDLDDDGKPHILFVNSENTLFYGHRQDTGWVFHEIHRLAEATSTDDLAFDLAISPVNGKPYIAYVDIAANQLLFGRQEGDDWLWEPIGEGGRLLSLQISMDGVPHLVLTGGQTIRYHTYYTGTWKTEIIDQSVAYVWNLFLDLDFNGVPRVAGSGANGSFYGLRDWPDHWLMETVPLANIEGFVTGITGEPYFLVTQGENFGGHPPLTRIELQLVTLSDGGWNYTLLWEGFNWYVISALAADETGGIHIAFIDPETNLHYIFNGPGNLETEEVPASHVDYWPIDLTLDQSGQPYISFGSDETLVLAHREVTGCDHQALIPVAIR